MHVSQALLDYLGTYINGGDAEKGVPCAKDSDRIIIFVQQRATASFITDMIQRSNPDPEHITPNT